MRDLPYVGVSLAHQVKPNDYWNLLTKVKSGVVAPSNPFNFGTGFSYANVPSSFGYSIGGRVYSFDCGRGRTYELGRLEAGEASFRVDNSDGLFDPNNTSSPLYGNVAPYRPVQIMAAYTAPANRTDANNVVSGNILNDTNHVNSLNPYSLTSSTSVGLSDYNAYRIRVCAKDSNFEGATPYNWYSPNTNGNVFPSIVTSQSHSGTSSLQFGYGTYGCSTAALQVPVVAGKTITISYWYLNTGASTAAHVCKIYESPLIDWSRPTAAATVTSAKANTGTWLRNTVTLTPSTNFVVISMEMQNTTNIVNDFTYIDDVMVEFGPSASASVVQTGPTLYPLWTGHVERYPQSYQAPNRGEANLVATDVFASLSQVSMETLYDAYCNSQISPSGTASCYYYYPMSEPAGSTAAYNKTSYSQNPLVATSINAVGNGITFGQNAANTKDLIGMGGTTVPYFYNSGLFGAGNVPYGTYLGVNNITDINFNASTTISFWVYLGDDPTDIALSTVFSLGDKSGVKWLSVRVGTGGILSIDWVKNGTATNVTTGSWDFGYFNFVTLTFSGGQVSAASISTLRGGGSTTNLSITSVSPLFTSPSQMIAGTASNFGVSSVGHLSVFQNPPNTFSSSHLFNLGKYGQITSSTTAESTGVRFRNTLFNITGFQFTPFIYDKGVSQMQALNPSGESVADYVQDVSDTEGGSWYIDSSGYIVFQDRADRQQNFAPAAIFGDNVAAGEIPYDAINLSIDYDPQFVYNEVEIVRANGATNSLKDINSIKQYFRRTFSRTIYNTSDTEARDAGYFILSRSKDPHPRPIQIVLTPSSNTAIWNTALGMEIDTLIRVRLKPLNTAAAQISIDCFVEKVDHSFDAQSGDWKTTLTITPAITNYWNMSPLRLTTSGANGSGFVLPRSGSATPIDANTFIGGYSHLLQYAVSGTYYRAVTIPSQTTLSGSTAFNVNAFSTQTVGTNSSGPLNGYKSTAAFTPSASSLATDSTSGVVASQVYWCNGEMFTASKDASNVLQITARGLYSTTPTSAPVGSAIVPVGAIPATISTAAGVVVTDWYSNVVNSNGGYSMPSITFDDVTSVIGQWSTVTYSAPTNTTSATPYVVNAQLALNPDNFNPAAADLCIGQNLSFVSTSGAVETLAVTSQPVLNSSGYLSFTGYKITDSGLTLAADAPHSLVTLNVAATPPSSGTIILIGNEFMTVGGGSSGAWSVVRGCTSLTGVPLSIGGHRAYDKIFYMSNTGFTGTYAANGKVYEGFNVSSAVTGTTRLGY
jgi:hypothetical protein